MSRKNENPPANLSTEHVDNSTGEITQVYTPPKLNKAGQEMPSAITLVAIPAMRDFDLGVRIQRYQRAPQSVQARLDEQYDDDDVDFDNHVDTEDTNPMSRHELRYDEARGELMDKQKARQKEKDEKRAQKLADEKAAFKAQYAALREEGAIPPSTSPESA